MEGVFTIRQQDGTTINMFQEPGMIQSVQVVDEWCADLVHHGV